MYFLCANANKIYLDALWRRHAALPADYSRKCLRVQNVCRMCLPRDIPMEMYVRAQNVPVKRSENDIILYHHNHEHEHTAEFRNPLSGSARGS
jgi:hypothetical protein